MNGILYIVLMSCLGRTLWTLNVGVERWQFWAICGIAATNYMLGLLKKRV